MTQPHTLHATQETHAHELACDWLLETLGWGGRGACVISDSPASSLLLALRQARAPVTQPWRVCATAATLAHVSPALNALEVPSAARIAIAHYEDHSMRPDALDTELASTDVATCVIATAGDPLSGAIDPLIEMADACRRHHAWLHVEGEYGAPAVALLDECVDIRAGLTSADSVTLQPHQWLYTISAVGVTLFRTAPNPLPATVSAAPLWPLIQHVGRQGYRRLIARDIAVAQCFRDWIAELEELEVLAEGLSVVCFRPVGASPERLAAIASQAEAPLDVSVVEWHDGPALRLLCADPQITIDHVATLRTVVLA